MGREALGEGNERLKNRVELKRAVGLGGKVRESETIGVEKR